MSVNTINNVEVAIIGGGIGGLVAAVALNRSGIEAHLYEAASVFGEAGGHLTIDTYVIDVLKRWGLDEPFMEMAILCNGIEVRSMATNEIISHYPIPDLGAMGVDDPNRQGTREVFAFLRADYVTKLAELMPADRLHVGHRLVKLEDGDNGATATFENGTSITADVVVGADGVRSIARQMLDDAPAVKAGITICRSLVPTSLMPADAPNDRLRFWDGWDLSSGEEAINVLIGPVRHGDGTAGAIDVLLHNGDQLDGVDPWDVPLERFLERLPKGTDPVIARMISGVIEPFVAHPLYDRATADIWTGKRITLLGDAAHATRPTMGQGACQAIHDAGALVTAIETYGLTTEALKSYESIRAPYVKSVIAVAKNTKMDPKAWKGRGQKAQAAG